MSKQRFTPEFKSKAIKDIKETNERGCRARLGSVYFIGGDSDIDFSKTRSHSVIGYFVD